MSNNQEFAEEYTTAERIRTVIIYGTIGALIIVISELWLFPWIRWFAETAPCHKIFGYSGVSVILYGVFVGVPLLSALTLGLILGSTGYKIIRDKQSPPKNTKVFRRTTIVYGKQALLRAYFALLIGPALFCPMAIWGYDQADNFIKSINAHNFDYTVCAENKAN